MRNVFLTGGSRGIGAAAVLALARAGYNVAFTYHAHPEAAEAVAAQARALSPAGTFLPICADAGDSAQVCAAVAQAEEALGSLQVLVCNAGIAQQKLFTDITPDEWKKMTGVNLDGVFYCSQQALKRYMIKNHSGVILNISSMWGQVGASCEVHYSASKAGVIGLTKGLAKEVGLSGVRVNCICPGVIMTDMMKGFDEQTVQELKEETPLNMLGMPEDIAETAVFLCSDRARFITGQIVGVNGGMII